MPNDSTDTVDQISSDLTQKDRIQILLSEYSALRAEIVSRTASGFTLTTIGIAVLTFVLKELSARAPLHYWLGALVLLVVFGLGVFVNLRDITKAAAGVKVLEYEINRRAGENLLTWEALSGGVTRKGGILASFFSTVRPLPRSKLPALHKQAHYEGHLVESQEGPQPSYRRQPNKKNPFRHRIFWKTLAVGVALVGFQGVCAYADGYLTQSQIMNIHKIPTAYSFIVHGGMWSDFFIINPIVAYLLGAYRFRYFSRFAFLVLTIAIIVAIVGGVAYQEMGQVIPEAHTHFGHTPLAGWIHALYAAAVTWILVMFYLSRVDPQPRSDIIVVSLGMTAALVLGIMKFTSSWAWSKGSVVQVALSIGLLWLVTAYRFGRYIERGANGREDG